MSPRVGFSWTYGTAPQLAVANGFVRGPRAVVRGGVGLFQNVPNTALIGGALSTTGLTSGVQQLTCVGSAVPTARLERVSRESGRDSDTLRRRHDRIGLRDQRT